MKLSLKTQLTLFLLIFISILVGQMYFAKTNQSGLINSFSDFQKTIIEEKLVRELEREVLDLQRQVLVFKDTGSQSSVNRFNALIIEVRTKLEKIKTVYKETEFADSALSTIEAMEQHINDYNTNFVEVVNGRYKRDIFFEGGIIVDIEILLASKSFTAMTEKNETLIAYFYSAENIAYRYLLQPSSKLKNAFIKKLTAAAAVAQKIEVEAADKEFILARTDDIIKKFLQLTHVTQGYTFLVNVVMAGSANEFLYLSQAMTKGSAILAASTDKEIQENIEESQTQMNLSSFIGILITLLVAFIAANRIFKPLRAITDVFGRLANGDDNVKIPYAFRKDEIGNLARAATVFSNKNKQTTDLLEQSQQLNSQQEALNKKLSEAKIQAEQANASKSMFLANMSHEIRTPMNGIIGLVDISLKHPLPTPIKNNLEKVAYSSQILMNVIKDILDFSKIEAGKLEIEESEFSLARLFDSLPALTVIPASEKKLNIEIFVDPNLPHKAIGDPLRISQVILNLSNNAIKFTHQGSVKISFYRGESDQENTFMLKVKVEDSGVGISKKQLESIFMPFTQVDNSTSRKYGGTGLGLSIVKQLTSLMKGEVSATSSMDLGSTFTCSFRLSESEPSVFAETTNTLQSPAAYFCDDIALLYPEYQKLIGCRVMSKSLVNKDTGIAVIPNDKMILIDIDTALEATLLAPLLQQLKDDGKHFGCITQTHPLNLQEHLKKNWHCPVLSHPFTPSELNQFTIDLESTPSAYTDLSNAVVDDDIDNKIEKNIPLLHGHILLAEDNAINQMLMGEILKTFGVTYEVAHDGRDAVEQLKADNHFDLVLMDVQMPIMDGIEATKIVRKSGNAGIPIIGVSAHAMQEDFDLARDSGMTDYLTKPVIRERLLDILSKHLKSCH